MAWRFLLFLFVKRESRVDCDCVYLLSLRLLLDSSASNTYGHSLRPVRVYRRQVSEVFPRSSGFSGCMSPEETLHVRANSRRRSLIASELRAPPKRFMVSPKVRSCPG